LDGLKLLMKEVLALLLIHVDLHLALDLVFQFNQLQIACNVLKHHFGALLQVGNL